MKVWLILHFTSPSFCLQLSMSSFPHVAFPPCFPASQCFSLENGSEARWPAAAFSRYILTFPGGSQPFTRPIPLCVKLGVPSFTEPCNGHDRHHSPATEALMWVGQTSELKAFDALCMLMREWAAFSQGWMGMQKGRGSFFD